MYNFQKIEHASPEVLDQIGHFRAAQYLTGGVQPPDPGFAKGCWLDPYDTRPNTIHWMVFDHTDLIATARLVIFNSFLELEPRDWIYPWAQNCRAPVGLLGRMVVHSDHRRKGIARRLLQLRLQEASRQKVATVFGAAIRDGYASSYAKAGFEELTEILDPSWNTSGERIHLMRLEV